MEKKRKKSWKKREKKSPGLVWKQKAYSLVQRPTSTNNTTINK